MDPHKTASLQTGTFETGTSVVYALHGKCTVIGIEERTVSDQRLQFYKLEVQKSALSRSTRQEPAIWIPVNSAIDRGVRLPMTSEQADEVLKILGNREYYFPLNEPWSVTLPKLEAAIRKEGGIGLAKAESYLAVLKKKLVVLPADVSRFAETVHKLLVRELSETLSRTPRSIEEQLQKGYRQKLLPSH